MEELLKKASEEIMATTERRLGATSAIALDLSRRQANEATDGARKILKGLSKAEKFKTSPVSSVSTAKMSPRRAEQFRQSLDRSAKRLTEVSVLSAETERLRSIGNARKLLTEFGITLSTTDAIIDYLKKEVGW